MVAEGVVSQVQAAALDALLSKRDRSGITHDPSVGTFARLKRHATEGNLDAGLELLERLQESKIYRRLGLLVLRKAALKRGDETALTFVEAMLAAEAPVRRATPAPSIGAGSGFEAFIKLKQAVALGDLCSCLQLARSLQGELQYKRAAVRLVQKLLLSDALSQIRHSDADVVIVKCLGCESALAMAVGVDTACRLCGRSMIRRRARQS